MNNEIGKPLCIATCQGRWAHVITYDDTGHGQPMTARLLFKTAEESAEACRRLNQPWEGDPALAPDPPADRETERLLDLYEIKQAAQALLDAVERGLPGTTGLRAATRLRAALALEPDPPGSGDVDALRGIIAAIEASAYRGPHPTVRDSAVANALLDLHSAVSFLDASTDAPQPDPPGVCGHECYGPGDALPCILEPDHETSHKDANGCTWARPRWEPVPPTDAPEPDTPWVSAAIAEAREQGRAEMRREALEAMRTVAPPSSATQRDLSMWDMMGVFYAAAVNGVTD